MIIQTALARSATKECAKEAATQDNTRSGVHFGQRKYQQPRDTGHYVVGTAIYRVVTTDNLVQVTGNLLEEYNTSKSHVTLTNLSIANILQFMFKPSN